jgi:hypothetical protein
VTHSQKTAWLVTLLAATGIFAFRHFSEKPVSTKPRGMPIAAGTRHLPRAPILTDSIVPAVNTGNARVETAVPSEDEAETEPPRLSDDLQVYRDYLDMMFDQDGRDQAWEAGAEARLRQGLARFQTREVRVDDVKCRASMCRAELSGDDAEALRRTKMELVQVSWPGPAMAAGVPEGGRERRVLAFFAREGHELPDG